MSVNNMMRKFTIKPKAVCLAFFLCLVLLLAACGQENAQPEYNAGNTPATSIEPEETSSDISSITAEPDETIPEKTTNEPSQTEEEPVGDQTVTEKPPAEEAGMVHIVEIIEFAFSPSKLEVKAGDTVTFINKDAVKHTATADDESFDTKLLAQNEKKQITFTKAGEYSYFCLPHPGMKGMIVVKES
jgi:plastocyanin